MALANYDELLAGDEPDQNPYDAILKQQTDAQTVTLKQSMSAAATTEPDQHAKVLKLADQYGVPSDLAQRAFKPLRRRAAVDDNPYDQLITKTPDLAKWLETPDHAAIARDDLDTLSTLDRVLSLGRHIAGAAGAGLMDFSRGVYGAVQAGAELAASTPGIAAIPGPTGAVAQLLGAPGVADFAAGSATVAARLAAKARGDQSQMGFIERNALGGVEGAAAMAPALLTGAVGGSAALMSAVGITGLGQGYTQARAEGASQGRALSYGGLDAAIQVGTFYLPAHALLGDLAAHAPLITSLAHQAVTAIPAMELQTALQDLNAWAQLPANKDRPFSEYLRERPSAAAATLVNTIAFVGATTAVGHATAKFFDQVGQVASASKTLKRAPDAVESFVNTAAQDGQARTVYLPIDSFTTYWQQHGVNPADAARELLGDTASYERATQTGEDLAVPLGRYVTHIAPTEHNAFFANEARLAPEEMNAREAQAFTKDLAQHYATPDESTADVAEPVRDAIVQQLVAAGTERSTAEAYATLHAAAFRTLGERAGVDPVELFKRYGLQINREDLPPVASDSRLGTEAAPASGESGAPAATDLTTFNQGLHAQLADAEAKLKGLDVQGSLEGSRRVPFPAIDAQTASTLYRAADLTQEHRVTVPIDKLVSTQDTISEPIAKGKLTGEQPLPRVLEYDGRYYLGDGTHTAAAAWARGEKTIDVLASPVDPTQIGSVTLHQGERGSISFGGNRQFNISLLKGADLTTFLHESGHFFLEVMQDLAKEPGAESIRKDLDALRAEYGSETFGTEQHEQFAKSFEAYLMEGKAPSAELRPVFARFRAWLVGVYRSVRGLGVELTPEVRGVFDRLVASDRAIEQASQEANIRPLFTDATSAGMTDAQFQQYYETVANASEKVREELQTKIMRDVQRERTKQWQDEREGVRATVAQETGEQPVYRALTAITKGLKPDGTPLVEGQEPTPMRLAKAELTGYSPETLKALRRLDAYRIEGGVSPDVAAQLTGYSSGDELVKSLAAAEPMKAAIERETDARMKAEHGDMLLDGSLAQHAEEAVNGEHRQTVVRAELKALTSAMVKGTIPPAAAINHYAETTIAGTRVRDLRPGQFLMAAKRASQKAFDLLSTNSDREGAVQAKQRELINLALYREATKAQDAVQATVDYLRSFDKASTRERIGKAGGDYLEQIDGLRERFDFATVPLKAIDKRQALAKWAAAQEAATGLPVNLPDELLNEARRTNYKDLSYEELTGVRDGVKMIAHLATLKNKLLKAQGSRDLAAAASEAVTSIAEHSKGPRATGIEVRLPGSSGARNIATFFASHRKLSSIVREMDGFRDGGVLWERVLRPLNEAADAEAVRTEAATKALHGLFDDAYKGEETSLYHKTFVPGINDSLSKMGRLMVALNWGNEGNQQRIRDGYHWTDDQVRGILDTLDARDVAFVNGVWKHIGSYWEDIAAKEKRVTGVAPERVEAVPFTAAGGSFDGGYFPIKYEHQLSARASANLEGSFAEGVQQAAYARATTQRGHTEARLTQVKEPVRLDFGVITDHVRQVIHDLTHHETLLDVSRVLAHRDVQDAIYQHYGDIAYDQIKGAVRDVAFGNTPAPGWYKTFNAIRAKSVTATLGLNAVTSLLHTLQIGRGMARVDPVSVLQGLGKWAVSARNAEYSAGWIEGQSDMMRLRWKTQQRELNEVRNQVGLDRGKVSAAMHDLLAKAGVDPGSMPAIADSYFYGIRKIVQFAEIPTWIGAYEKAMKDETNDEARSIALADQAVIDSMGSGHIKDLAAVQRAPMARVFTTFYDYHNAVYQQAVELAKKDANFGRKMVDATALLFVPVALSLGLNSLTATKTDKRTLLTRLAESGLDYGLGMFAGVRELEGAFTRADWSGPAGMKFIPTARNFLYQGGELASKAAQGKPEGKTPTSFLRASNELGGALFGYPARQIDRTAQGIQALMSGKTSDLSAVVFGPGKAGQ